MKRNVLDHIYHTSACLGRQQIHAYLSGQATPEECRQVEHHLLDCPLCSDAVEGYEEAGSTPLTANQEDFSVFAKKLSAAEGAKIRTLTPGRIALRAAAAVAVLLLAWQAAVSVFGPSSPDKLVDQFYKPYSNDLSLVIRSEGDSTVKLHPALSDALSFYEKQQFAQSLPLFEQCLQAEPTNSAAHFFAGMACFETQQWEKAISHFEIVKNAAGNYARMAAWYAILATLKTGDRETAKTLLNGFLQDKGSMEEEARQLLKKI